MKTRSISFSAPMVRANRRDVDPKTETRRMITPQPTAAMPVFPRMRGALCEFYDREEPHHHEPSHLIDEARCPYGQPGDRLRVKEAAWMWCEKRPNGLTPTGRPKWLYEPLRSAPVYYVADSPERPLGDPVPSPDTGNAWGWRFKVARFLPSWASRDTLEITAIRAERLQEITEEAAKAEGVDVCGMDVVDAMIEDGREPAQIAYEELWETINGPGSWDANPFVWVIQYRRLPHP